MTSIKLPKIIYHPGRMELGHVTAVLFKKTQGALFSGWIVSNNYDRYHYTDPICTKARAIFNMKLMYKETIIDAIREES
jgi:hypothetical protein